MTAGECIDGCSMDCIVGIFRSFWNMTAKGDLCFWDSAPQGSCSASPACIWGLPCSSVGRAPNPRPFSSLALRGAAKAAHYGVFTTWSTSHRCCWQSVTLNTVKHARHRGGAPWPPFIFRKLPLGLHGQVASTGTCPLLARYPFLPIHLRCAHRPKLLWSCAKNLNLAAPPVRGSWPSSLSFLVINLTA